MFQFLFSSTSLSPITNKARNFTLKFHQNQGPIQSPIQPSQFDCVSLHISPLYRKTLRSHNSLSMAGEKNPNSAATGNNKKRKHYRPNNKPVKKKGAYPLRPGVQGFFITCDGGRERQASHEALNVIDSFYEELVYGKDSCEKLAVSSDKPLNKKIKFVYSDEEEEEEDDDDDASNDENEDEEEKKADTTQTDASKTENTEESKSENNEESKHPVVENPCHGDQIKEKNDEHKNGKDSENETKELKEPPAKKQCTEAKEQKSVDELIEDELKELGDKSKRRFFTLDSGCNGVVFVQMRKGDGDPSPKDIAQHMMTSVALTKKHMSRFILRVLPVEASCYSSEEEISKAMIPIVEKHFPSNSQDSHKFAVLYEARANTGIDRMKIINAVAKSVPGPHKVDLSNPDKTIVVEIVKTVCLIGVVEKYKELAKYNLRQLTSPQ